jgi:twinkle protein
MGSRLSERGIDPQVAQRLGMWSGEAKAGGGEALVIPFYRDGVIVARKFRTLGPVKKFWQDAGGAQCLWNEDVLRRDDLIPQALIITEGELDAVAAIQCGFERTVSVPAGAPEKPIGDRESAKYGFIDAARPFLTADRVSEIILAVDGDSAGANLLQDLSLRLGRFRCKWLKYPLAPDDKTRRLKDLNEVLVHYGQKGVVETINRAQWIKVDGIYRMSELPPLPDPVVFDIGFPKLREHYRARLGDFAVVTGIPSMGKTSWVNDLVCRLVWNHGVQAAFASFEQSPQRDHRRNLRCWYLKRYWKSAEADELAAADKWIDENFTFLVPGEDDDVTLQWLFDRMEASVVQRGASILVIDPWNELDHMREQGETQTEYVGRAIKALKRFARKLNIHLIVVAHPTKMAKNADGLYSVPSLYDISDSSHWYNKPDIGIIVHRDKDQTIIRVAKSRYHDEIGKPGEVFAAFDHDSKRFEIL